MDLVTLHNGAKVPRNRADSKWHVLMFLRKYHQKALAELLALARNAEHRLGISKLTLKALGLIDHQDKMDDTLRDIVLSAVEGEEPNMTVRHAFTN